MLFNFIVTVLIMIAVFSGFMYVKQPDMIFFPIKELRSAPDAWGFSYDDISFETSDGVQLNGWYIPGEKAGKTLLFFHGNAGNISHRAESVTIFHNMGMNVFIFDYRGYGKSQGSPTEQGLYEDARAAWRYLTVSRGINASDIILFGRSLGGAVATRLAVEVKAGGLILESTFSSGRDMAKQLFPTLSHLIFVRFQFNTADIIGSISQPLLVLHSPDDEIIPYTLGKKVFEAASQPKQFVDLKGDHNSGFMQSQPAYQESIGKFITATQQVM